MDTLLPLHAYVDLGPSVQVQGILYANPACCQVDLEIK